MNYAFTYNQSNSFIFFPVDTRLQILSQLRLLANSNNVIHLNTFLDLNSVYNLKQNL